LKQARSAFFVLLVTVLIVTGFAFGRTVRNSVYTPLRQAHMLASEQANKNLWQVEAQNGSAAHDLSVPASYSLHQQVAQNGSDSDSDSGLFSADSPLVTFQQVYELLKQQYVDSIPDDTPLAHGAVSALVASLDEPNSRFLEPVDRLALDEQSKGIFGGIGVVFTVRKETVDGLLERQLTIIDAVDGSPAQKAGLQTGDVVTDINGHWVISYDPFAAQVKMFKTLSSDPVSFNHAVDTTEAKIKDGLDLSKAQAMLNGTSSTPLALSVLRGGKSVKITVDASTPTQVEDVSSKVLPDGNGYIKFDAFTDTTADDFDKAFATVSSTPGIVIDLRSCPGGSMDPALTMSEQLDSSQPLGSVLVRDNHGSFDKTVGFSVRTEELMSSLTPAPINYSGHIAVLMNEGTANVAELFGAFLHDRLGARIIGNSSFGDGMSQTLFPMGDGSAMILTTGIVMTGKNYEFEAKGITPDVALAESETDSPAGIERAEELLSLKPLNASAAAADPAQQKS
jgi:carboxyl-terminal processing protease